MSSGVADVARAAGVSPHTVRYYVARGLLRTKKDPRSGYHRFTDVDTRTLTFVRRAQALGFTLREIETVIAMSRRHESPCPTVRDIVRRRVGEFAGQLAELDETCRRMRGAIRLWQRMPDSVPTGDEICRLIESVAAPARGPHLRGTPTPSVEASGEGIGRRAGLTFERLKGRASRVAGPRRRARRG